MSQNLKIDLDKCIKCKACVRNCPTKVIELTPAGAQEKYPALCIACGHCVAACPVGAIQDLKIASGFDPIQNPAINFEQFNNLGRNRRSIRNFKSQPVEKEVLTKILESARYIPTGSNAQELQYLVISDSKRLQMISNAMKRKTESILFKTAYRMIYGKKAIERQKAIISRFASDEDYFLRNAPVLIIIYVKNKTPMCNIDAGIAGHHINLACETLGLGVCWMGHHTMFSQHFASIAKTSLVPKKHYVVASLCLGYPDEKYYKTCARDPLKITWV